MKVVTLARQNNKEDDLFGSICVFNTIRVGFPTADIEVWHSGDTRIMALVPTIKGAVENFIPNHFRHDEWIQYVINENSGELVIVDTDMIFYADCEKQLENYPAMLAGRKVPAYYNEVVKADEVERIHTSFMYIKSASRLKHWLAQAEQRPNYPLNPYAPFQFRIEEKPFFFDTCANMYHMLPYHLKHDFNQEFLNNYTHLVSGTMLNHVSGKLTNGERLKKLHFLAKENPNSVRGLWQEQNQFYINHPPRN